MTLKKIQTVPLTNDKIAIISGKSTAIKVIKLKRTVDKKV